MLRTAERQVRGIETRLAARDQPPVERERDVRMLMSLTRVLRDLKVLGGVEHAAPSTEPQRSTEELRASVARKLEAIIARQGQETR